MTFLYSHRFGLPRRRLLRMVKNADSDNDGGLGGNPTLWLNALNQIWGTGYGDIDFQSCLKWNILIRYEGVDGDASWWEESNCRHSTSRKTSSSEQNTSHSFQISKFHFSDYFGGNPLQLLSSHPCDSCPVCTASNVSQSFWEGRNLSKWKELLKISWWWRNSGESSGPSKKWPRGTTDPVRAGITEKRAFLRSAEKWFLA